MNRRTLMWTVGVTICSVCLSPIGARAQSSDGTDWREILPGVTMGAQLRLRAESRQDYRFDDAVIGNDDAFLLSRLRFGVTWRPHEQVTGVLELQDARIHGDIGIDQSRTPNIFADQLDVHQAYLDVTTSTATRVPITLRLGRQKLVYGSQRLISPLEWVNTARVFDGVKVSVGVRTGRTLDGFATRLVPVSPAGFNDHGPTPSRMFNSQFYGVYYTDTTALPNTTVEGYWLLRREDRIDDAVRTAGGRVETAIGPWSVDGEVARQGGTFGGLRHRATMFHVGGAYATPLVGRPTFGVALNGGSGDDDPDDGVHGTFDNLYPLNHVFYGYMDLFALQNLRNTELSVEMALPRRGSLRMAYQFFWLDEPGTDAWYDAGAGRVHLATETGVASHVGRELDITFRIPVWHVGLEVGYGHFFGGDYLRETGFARRSADFFYLQTVVGF